MERAKENKEASKIPRGLLDFSSASEEDDELQGLKRKVTSHNAVDGNNATGPSRMGLLHHGFSRLLERVKGTPASADEDSPGVAESLSDTDTKDEGNLRKSEATSSGICKSSTVDNSGVCALKLGMKSWDSTSGSDREDESKKQKVILIKDSSEAVIKRQGPTGWRSKKTTIEKVPTMHRFHSYSDESEDFELGGRTQSKKEPLNALGCSKKRQSASVRNKARSKDTEDIETFTSSEEEHSPYTQGRPLGCPTTSPQDETSRAEMTRDRQRTTTDRMKRHKAVSFTSLKNRTSPASKEGQATIDTVLGQSQVLCSCADKLHKCCL